MEVRIESIWKNALAGEFGKPYFESLVRFLHQEKAQGKRIFPPGSQIFKAFDLTPLDQVKVVILGQDPYHGPGQAHGLSFSVPEGVPAPPSLKNIFKEIESDLGVRMSGYPNLEKWARQGVLLLNAVLTVQMGMAASHQGRGWERFTDAIIRLINARPEPVVFMLWGSYAQKKAAFVDSVDKGGRHLVLKSAHPSPLSAHNGFFGSKPFSKANAFLQEHGQKPIDWALPALM
jgi:uracil-DNA glycosylase